jgi:hypothetical protein
LKPIGRQHWLGLLLLLLGLLLRQCYLLLLLQEVHFKYRRRST